MSGVCLNEDCSVLTLAAARPKLKRVNYKAGNLNYGLQVTSDIARMAYQAPAPFIAVIDADMIVEPNWLRTMIPHLMQNEHLAMACPPQVWIFTRQILHIS